MSPLPGNVPTGQNDFDPKKIFEKKTASAVSNEPGQGVRGLQVRPDFQRELETRLKGWLGRPGSETYTTLRPMVEGHLKPSSTAEDLQFDLSSLPTKARTDLEKLQNAAEGLEAVFVKKLLGQMRSVSFDKHEKSPMGDFAKDLLDEKIAESAAKGRSSIGIAKMVFTDTAQQIVRSAISNPSVRD